MNGTPEHFYYSMWRDIARESKSFIVDMCGRMDKYEQL